MDKKYISIDGGTSNTRVALLENGTVRDRILLNYGAKDNLDGNCGFEKNKLGEAIRNILERNRITASNIEAVLASGMITSENGLYEVPHIVAPAGISELHNGIVKKYIPDICDIPFAFIPGVKTESDNLECADIMRGEETELMGLDTDINDSLVVLPGSHSKCISISKDGKIFNFHTFLTGEMIYALSQDTILKKSLGDACALDNKYLKIGFEYCRENGINETLFKTRILDTVYKCNPKQRYGFFVGGLLYGEISYMLNSPQNRIVVAGKKELKYPAVYLLREFSEKEIICVGDVSADNAPALGMLKIYAYADES